MIESQEFWMRRHPSRYRAPWEPEPVGPASKDQQAEDENQGEPKLTLVQNEEAAS